MLGKCRFADLIGGHQPDAQAEDPADLGLGIGVEFPGCLRIGLRIDLLDDRAQSVDDLCGRRKAVGGVIDASIRDIGVFREGIIRRRERAQSVCPADNREVFVVELGDIAHVALGLGKGGHAAILNHAPRACIIRGQRFGDGAKGIELGGDVARAAAQIFNRDVGIDAHVGGGAGHKLGETVGPNRAGRGDVKPAFLLDQSLKQAAPLRGRQPCARHTRRTSIFRGDLYDHHLDGFASLPK